jgi:putative ABC transport system substrate-binding protein
MRPRELVGILSGAAAWPLVARAQHQRIPRLCFLTFDPGTLRTRSSRFDGFFQGLQNLGYEDGRG